MMGTGEQQTTAPAPENIPAANRSGRRANSGYSRRPERTPAGRALPGLAQRALDSSLSDDARTARTLIDWLRHRLEKNGQLLSKAETPRRETLDRWCRNGGLPAEFGFLCEVLEEGEQPVFAALSIHLRTDMTPTLLIPVPYMTARRGFRGLCASLWVNAGEAARKALNQEGRAESFARLVSHALLNTAFEVRVRDRPCRGWLAYAHYAGKTIYIPEVRGLSSNDEEPLAVSTATDEERFLGMASVLYVPLLSIGTTAGIPSKTTRSRGAHEPCAAAVLMLWSPVPRRWDHVSLGREPLGTGVYQATEPVPGIERLSPMTRAWLESEVSHAERRRATNDSSLLATFEAVDDLTKDRSTALRKELEQALAHNVGELIKLLRDEAGETRLTHAEWVSSFFRRECTGGLYNLLLVEWGEFHTQPRITQAKVRGWQTSRQPADAVPIDAWASGISLDTEHLVPITPGVARAIAGEFAKNLTRYTAKVSMIDVETTLQYVAISIQAEPTRESRARIHGSPDGFRQYYALRHSVPRAKGTGSRETGLGIGLTLHSAATSQLGIYLNLYLTPDGSKVRLAIAAPLQSKESAL